MQLTAALQSQFKPGHMCDDHMLSNLLVAEAPATGCSVLVFLLEL